MEINVVIADCTEHPTPLLVVQIFEGESELAGPAAKVDGMMGGLISDVVRRGDFKGREGQTQVLYPRQGEIAAERVLLVGLGKRDDLDPERLRKAAATSVKSAARLGVDAFATVIHHAERVEESLPVSAAARAVAEGMLLGSFVFDEFKTGDSETPASRKPAVAEILEKVEQKATEIGIGVRIGSALARGESLARRLGNMPGNVATPTYLGECAREISDRFGMKLTLLGPDDLAREKMTALLAVSQGSDEEPRLIVLEHRKGGGGRPIVLVGKGLTFDSGGISIKPSQGMEEMKFDMCGGAAVLGAMQAIGDLDVPVDVIGIVPASENLLSGKAYKPGDIIRTHLGKTVEVVNTDAEGRLILADALSYARRFDPVAIVDAATLTGSCVIALGSHASGALSNDEGLLGEIRAAGERVGQRVWPLPMYDEYREQIKSEYADIKNSGGRAAGTITAGWFLREFVGDTPWVHLDIAGTASGDGKLAYHTKGATGAPTRLLVEWAISRAG